MVRRSSNRDRIARMAAEKAARLEEKEQGKTSRPAKPAGKSHSARHPKVEAPKAAARMRLVWVVCDNAGDPVKTFDYPQFEEAKEEAARLTEKKGKIHFVKKDRAPMEA